LKKSEVKIEVFADADDPQLVLIRQAIHEAMSLCGLMPAWDEKYAGYTEFPKRLRRKKLPVITINETVVWYNEKNDSVIQSNDLIKNIRDAQKKPLRYRLKRMLRMNFSFLLAFMIAFFPKCPLCWAAYLSTLGLYKFSSITYKPWMLPVLIVMLFLNVLSLYLSRKRHHAGPLILSLAGSLLIVLNRFYFDQRNLIFIGSGILFAGAMWNSLPKNMVISFRKYLGYLFGKKRQLG